MSRAFLVGAKQVVVGASSVVEVNATSYQQGGILKKLTSVTLAVTDGLSFGVATGYPIADSEVIQFYGPARFYLAAAGSTCTIAVMRAYSDGATGLPTLAPIVLGGLI